MNGCFIVKIEVRHSLTGKIKKEAAVYAVYDASKEDGFLDVFKTLKEAQECARNYCPADNNHVGQGNPPDTRKDG